MDKTDLRILRELNDDARKSFREIAKEIGVSTQTVIKRYNEMKERGIIQICAMSIDATKIGYEGLANLLITSSPGRNLSDAMERLKKTENIIIATSAVGDYEGYAVLIFRNAADLYEKTLKIKMMAEVGKVEVSFDPFIFPIPPHAQNKLLFE
jgi:Lrp/AsnC family transcriptional regulator for asnA, asnC and gidA